MRSNLIPDSVVLEAVHGKQVTAPKVITSGLSSTNAFMDPAEWKAFTRRDKGTDLTSILSNTASFHTWKRGGSRAQFDNRRGSICYRG